jgi:hypothetical protein
MHYAEIAIRMTTADDEPALLRLAELDSAAPLTGEALIASVDHVPVAAHALTEGRTIADPFRPTAEIVELLEARAANLRRLGSAPAAAQSGWRTTGLRAAPASSSRRTGVV